MGVFLPHKAVKTAMENIARYSWARDIRDRIVSNAKPWDNLSLDETWHLMFGNKITRSYMVWSDGYCPSCKKGVPMYNWLIDAFRLPWKVQCPCCGEIFPKNDFAAYYASGIDARGIFDPGLADCGLLYNEEHKDPSDPLYGYGVDDGEGYANGDKRWRFIGAYLIYGLWRQTILAGIRNLSAAYLVTDNLDYSRKAIILLDRIADLYPTFDWSKQGLCYEGDQSGSPGYVTGWHDSCIEMRDMALAYDIVSDAVPGDETLAGFLSKKSEKYGSANVKRCSGDILRNIESRIFEDALNNRPKIMCNYPNREITVLIIETVLKWPGNRDEIIGRIGEIVETASKIDGVSGEKGIGCYTYIATTSCYMLLGLFSRVEDGFLAEFIGKYRGIYNMYRFYRDIWCLEKYYPLVGDGGYFGKTTERFLGLEIFKDHGADFRRITNGSLLFAPSMFTFLWRLYQATGDTSIPKLIYKASGAMFERQEAGDVHIPKLVYKADGGTVDGLPFDLFYDEPLDMQNDMKEIISGEGVDYDPGSVNKSQWRLAVLRSGKGRDARAVWISYDSGGGHGHANAMNLGMFAKGVNLMPDFGYPPVNYGGWASPQVEWYKMTAAHNTVVVDGRDQKRIWNRADAFAAETAMWAVGGHVRAIRVSGADVLDGSGYKQYERTVAMIDISPEDFYLVDVFRVAGGEDHARFMHSYFSEAGTSGLVLKQCPDFGNNTILRGSKCDDNPQDGWQMDWKIHDRYGLVAPGSDIHLRLTDLSGNSSVTVAEGWVLPGEYDTDQDAWIPFNITRRKGNNPLSTTFAGIIEPYEGKPNITAARRLPLQTGDGLRYPEANVALEITLANGDRDIFISADMENPLSVLPSKAEDKVLMQKDYDFSTDAELTIFRIDGKGDLRFISAYGGTFMKIGQKIFELKENEYTEIDIEKSSNI